MNKARYERTLQEPIGTVSGPLFNPQFIEYDDGTKVTRWIGWQGNVIQSVYNNFKSLSEFHNWAGKQALYFRAKHLQIL